MHNKPIGAQQLDAALTMLSELLSFYDSEPVHIVVCGGSALIALELVIRTTRDLDILAMWDHGMLIAPVPLPDKLCKAADEVCKALKLPDNWLNNGPSSNNGGLFQMGLPDGLEKRTFAKTYGKILTVSFIGRIDQIYFKLWASIDQGGYHIDDLLKLNPTPDEITNAARWTMEKDVSEGYRFVLIEFLEKTGFNNVIKRITQ
ncbi:MAG: hypothetical protein GX640_12050 [Fibrobacter sp.]|nr:hypothetical protein [Fibrobacter sp.]